MTDVHTYKVHYKEVLFIKIFIYYLSISALLPRIRLLLGLYFKNVEYLEMLRLLILVSFILSSIHRLIK